ncbi:E3 SUMO-protein ligase NSE2-like [Drosophila subpulchrella]|uniref:E3 SUMO-protein ligase NSE2-like n=1 Tax=Drosophila subpulchrella TaxID=1486046 RepID=UPI0018A1A0A0|nr:E3 SUMO-protein ligase NSE2-like [Drosophila subpulchrella]XP_037710769.1 E3 SUMO-protein ligase NSE2-like [Drosophila subpulchrella]
MEFNQFADSALSSLLETTKFLQEISEGISDDDGEIRKLLEDGASSRLEHAEKIIERKTKHKELVQGMQEARGESATVEEFGRTWNERRDAVERKPINAKNTAEYQSFKRSVESSFSNAEPEANDSDDDVVAMEKSCINAFSPYDPWTKALIRNPVRNKMCGHIYDREYVIGLIKNNIGIRCPVAGCANTVYIHPAHLIEDEAVRQKIRLQVMQDMQSDTDDDDEEETHEEVEQDDEDED